MPQHRFYPQLRNVLLSIERNLVPLISHHWDFLRFYYILVSQPHNESMEKRYSVKVKKELPIVTQLLNYGVLVWFRF